MIILITVFVMIGLLLTPMLPPLDAEDPLALRVGVGASQGAHGSFVPTYKSLLFGIGPLAVEISRAAWESVVQTGVGGRLYLAPYLVPLFRPSRDGHAEAYLQALGFWPPAKAEDIGGPPGGRLQYLPDEIEYVQSCIGTGVGFVLELGAVQLAVQVRTSVAQSSLGRWTANVELGGMVYVQFGSYRWQGSPANARAP